MLTAAAPAPQTKSGQSLSSFIEESDGNLSTDCVEFKAIKQRPSPTQLPSFQLQHSRRHIEYLA